LQLSSFIMADTLVGASIEKTFPGYGTFSGTVLSAGRGFYQVRYSDGDQEELTMRELKKLIQLPKTAKKTHQRSSDGNTCTPVDETRVSKTRVSKTINYAELSDDSGGDSDCEKDAEHKPIRRRKRKQVNSLDKTQSECDEDFKPADEGQSECDDDDNFKPKQQTKKTKLTTKSAQSKGSKSKGPKLRLVLGSLDKSQLVDLIERLTNSDAGLEERIREAMPEPDLNLEKLTTLKNKIFRAFPYSRWGSSRDNYAYNRVSPHIQTFKKEFNAKLASLQKSGAHEPTLKFIKEAVPLVNSLPHFDNEDKNKYIGQMKTKMHKVGTVMIKKAIKAGDDITQFQQTVDGLAPLEQSS